MCSRVGLTSFIQRDQNYWHVIFSQEHLRTLGREQAGAVLPAHSFGDTGESTGHATPSPGSIFCDQYGPGTGRLTSHLSSLSTSQDETYAHGREKAKPPASAIERLRREAEEVASGGGPADGAAPSVASTVDSSSRSDSHKPAASSATK